MLEDRYDLKKTSMHVWLWELTMTLSSAVHCLFPAGQRLNRFARKYRNMMNESVDPTEDAIAAR